ncbi:MAG: peptide chain release factor N(5)-glutamine methyltransferase [Bacteroidaceae bacterium]|nr:peptide chain release factor N(5)-glutamine methyltransferase [Bacteroidaceae bacterium]
MSGFDLYHNVKQILLQGGISEGESSALAFMLIEETTQLSKAQILTSDCDGTDADSLLSMAQTIASGTPIQQVLGYAYFCGLKLKVTPSVLIPRPETEELVRWVVDESPDPRSILDIGTGSGCIAIALAKALPQTRLTAIDISDEALAVARENAKMHDADIDFIQADILNPNPSLANNRYDVIVSNPPYICNKEADEMEKNVLDHEPHVALFVPDDDPLLFYRAIAEKTLTMLTPDGTLFFEINRLYAQELTTMLQSMGFQHITVRQDQFNNDRMLRASLQ